MAVSRFESIGVYLPDKVVTTQELIDQMEHKPQFDLEDLTGIRERRWRSDHENSHTLAVSAAQKCLAHSKYDASDLDIIISCSITRFKNQFGTPFFQFEPALSKHIKDDIGMPRSAINFDITNACAGMMTGVFLLDSMIKAGTIKRGMVVSGECITPITETAIAEISEIIDPQFASMTVGDSGAACILDNSPDGEEGINLMEIFTLAGYADLCFGMPSDKSHGGIAMYTDAMAIHKEVIDRLPDILDKYKNKHKVGAEDFDFVIAHQTSKRAIKTALDICIPKFKRSDNDHFPTALISLDRYGNTSSTSHFVVMDDYIKKGVIKPGDNILYLVLASGIILGAVAAKIGHLEVS